MRNFLIARADISSYLYPRLILSALSKARARVCVTATLISKQARRSFVDSAGVSAEVSSSIREVAPGQKYECHRAHLKLSLSLCDALHDTPKSSLWWTPFSWEGEPGENCIDNTAIAWVATLNLSLCTVRERDDGEIAVPLISPTPERRANGRSRAFHRGGIRTTSPSPTMKSPFSTLLWNAHIFTAVEIPRELLFRQAAPNLHAMFKKGLSRVRRKSWISRNWVLSLFEHSAW